MEVGLKEVELVRENWDVHMDCDMHVIVGGASFVAVPESGAL